MSFLNSILWSPEEYAELSVLARVVGAEMLTRLDFMTLQPEVVLDVGCGTGFFSPQLAERYKKAKVFALDLAFPMVDYAKQSQSELTCLCADGACLPFPDTSVDFIFANFMFPWHGEMNVLLQEWLRVLRPEGLLMFTAFGPDTLREWQPLLQNNEMPARIDMHEIGDLLLQTGFSDPVLDVDYYTMTYRDKEKFATELYATGMLSSTENLLQAETSALQATYEIIYAHAFTPPKRDEVKASSDGVVRIPVADLRRQLSSKR